MTVQILKPTIESGEPAFLASIDGEAPEIYSEKALKILQQDKSQEPDITEFVNYADC
jgi:hypothetical protein